MDSLIVYLNDIPVGRLTDDGREMFFAYDRAYAADARNEPLSPNGSPSDSRVPVTAASSTASSADAVNWRNA